MNEYSNLDMVKSLVRSLELLAEENKQLRSEIEALRNPIVLNYQLSDEAKQKLEEAFGTK